jgi:hypothetical protein
MVKDAAADDAAADDGDLNMRFHETYSLEPLAGGIAKWGGMAICSICDR